MKTLKTTWALIGWWFLDKPEKLRTMKLWSQRGTAVKYNLTESEKKEEMIVEESSFLLYAKQSVQFYMTFTLSSYFYDILWIRFWAMFLNQGPHGLGGASSISISTRVEEVVISGQSCWHLISIIYHIQWCHNQILEDQCVGWGRDTGRKQSQKRVPFRKILRHL